MNRARKALATSRPYWEEARVALAATDPIMGNIIELTGAHAPEVRDDAFTALARSIIGQQVSVHAARAIWNRLADTVSEITPSAFANTREETLRACGISQRKASYLHALAQHFTHGPLARARWRNLDDDAIIALLCEVKGIGRWTAEMFLIFHVCRPDVFSMGDVGLRRAVHLHYGNNRKLPDKRIEKISSAWSPWRSVASVYLWRSLEIVPNQT